MNDLYIGEIWRNKKGIEREIIDLVHSGYDPDDPNDMGSFEEFNVHYKDKNGTHIMPEFKFQHWIEKTKAELIFIPNEKEGFRDEN